MSVYITIDGTRYDDLKSVSFEPQYDPRMESLPICEFSAVMLTDENAEAFEGKTANLYHLVISDRSTEPWTTFWQCLAQDYTITQARRTEQKYVEIRAVSMVDYLDQRVLAAKMYNQTPQADFMYDVFEGATVNEIDVIPTDEWFSYEPSNRYVTMFCPRQTARERLLWYCLAYGYRVIQWGDYSSPGGGEEDTPSVRVVSTQVSNYRLVEPSDIYYRPMVERVSRYRALTMTDVGTITDQEMQGEAWRKCVVQEPGETEEGMEVEGEIWYARISTGIIRRAGMTEGDVAAISDSVMVWASSYVNKDPWFMDYEVSVDILWDMYVDPSTHELAFAPGSGIEVSTDGRTSYRGIVKSVKYVFGRRERLSLVVVTDMQTRTLTGVEVIVKYTYNGNQLGYETLFKPAYTALYYAVKSVWVNTPGGMREFYANYSSLTILFDSNKTVEIQCQQR